MDRPMVFLDLEATGVDAQRDRIVQVACIKLAPDGSRDAFDSLVDPQVPIPRESSAVHGITDEQVRGQPAFRDLAPRLLDYFAGCDFGGFGICRFDLPMLSAEFKRAGMPFDLAGRRTVDSLLIFHRLEPRTLSAAVKFYCGKPLERAHDARADTEAALQVLLAQVERYGAGPSALPSDPQGLHDFCCAQDPRHVDAKGKFVWRHGVATFAFGKHQTRALEEVARLDRSYLEWLAKAESTPPDVVEICRRALAGIVPRQAQPGDAQAPLSLG
ncbi:MAG: 3'-5' exonuclease [Elusimicrobia bacterium]|nr:3'-5' exonuclease [Elusimicrobiota bacterium]